MSLSAVWAQLTVNESGTTGIVQVHLTPWVRNKRIEDTTALRHEKCNRGYLVTSCSTACRQKTNESTSKRTPQQDIFPSNILRFCCGLPGRRFSVNASSDHCFWGALPCPSGHLATRWNRHPFWRCPNTPSPSPTLHLERFHEREDFQPRHLPSQGAPISQT